MNTTTEASVGAAAASEPFADNSLTRGMEVVIIDPESPFCGQRAPIVSSARDGSACSVCLPGQPFAVWMTRQDILP